MRILFRRSLLPALLVLLALFLAACQRSEPYQASEYIFGTRVDIEIAGLPQDQARAAADQVFAFYRRLHTELHAWQPGALMTLNQTLAKGEPAQATPHILELIRLSQQYETTSGGLFNPAIGKLIALWGFHHDQPKAQPPTAEQVSTYMARLPHMSDYHIEGDTVTTDNPNGWLDFGGIAKGWAVDKGMEMLQKAGVENAIINAGGDLKSIGSHGDRAWRVGVRDPQGGVLAALEARDNEAIFTSGNYERFYQWNGKRFHHIIDPRNGYPAQQSTSVTVISHDSALADAAATALLVAGVRDWKKMAEKMGLDAVLVVTRDGKLLMTPAMEKRLQLINHKPIKRH